MAVSDRAGCQGLQTPSQKHPQDLGLLFKTQGSGKHSANLQGKESGGHKKRDIFNAADNFALQCVPLHTEMAGKSHWPKGGCELLQAYCLELLIPRAPSLTL